MYETLVSVQPWNWIYMNFIKWFNIVYRTVCSVQVKYNTHHHVSKAEPNSKEMHTNSTWLLPFSSTENIVRVQVSHIIYCCVEWTAFHIQKLVSSHHRNIEMYKWHEGKNVIKLREWIKHWLTQPTLGLWPYVLMYIFMLYVMLKAGDFHTRSSGPSSTKPPANELILCKW